MDLKAVSLVALRVVAGILFFSHGAQKLFGWFGGAGPDGATVELASRLGVAGLIEVVAGAGIALGIATRALAFIASGEMAVAYFWSHVAGAGSLWWWRNRGELAVLYCFVWLYFAAKGPGGLSVDTWRRRRRR